MIEREITQTTPLTLPNGRLNPGAVGWMREPLVSTEGIDGRRSWGRNKRWEYWNVVTPTHILALTVSSLDYAGVHEVWIFDRHTEKTIHQSVTVPFGRGATLPQTLGSTSVRARARGLAIDIDEVSEGTRLRVAIDGGSFDVVAVRPAGHECLGVVVPWSDRRFQYTVKDVARPATGMLNFDGVVHELPAGECWAVLDHGRGRWPYDMRWNWGAGSGISGGLRIGVQLGGQWTNGTGSTENAFFVDGRLHKISEELTWEYDVTDYLKPWRVYGRTFDATFTPVYDKITRTNMGIVSSSTDQCFGDWAGTFTTVEGKIIEFGGIFGWAEDVHNRW